MSRLPSVEDLRNRFDDDADFAAELPDRPIASLRDIQYLYGRLYTLATAGGGEYAAYLTPDQARDLLDEPESLVVVDVDLTGDKPSLAEDDPVMVTRYTEDHIDSVAHCWYDSARGVDHSVTHRTGRDKSPEKIAEYAQDRFTRWATDDIVSEVAETHDDGDTLEAIASLGADDATMDRLADLVTSKLGGTTTALITVRVRRSGDNEYQWPGDLVVFNEAMRQRKLSKLVSKNEATESAGQATDIVTGDETRTVGTAEDPLNYFLGKQMETFPGFDPNEAWRTHPISEDAAVTIMNAAPLVDACTYSTYGATVYCLPYIPKEVTVDRALLLYRLLRAAFEGGDLTPIEDAYEMLNIKDRRAEELRFYVTAVMKHQSKRFDVFGDTMNGRLHYPVDLERAHLDILEGPAFNPEAQVDPRLQAALPTHENWPLLSRSPLINSIVSGRYFADTFSRADDDQDAAADDVRIDALVSVLSGDPIPVEVVLSEYVSRLIDEEGEEFPHFHVASQFAQLSALAQASLLTAHDETNYASITHPPTFTETMEDTQSLRADGGAVAEARAEKLEQFIESTPALADKERRGVFLLGALIGQVGGYQQSSEERSTTVVDNYPIKSMSLAKFKRVTHEVIDKDIVYSRENGMGSTMYAEVIDRLVDTLTETDPEQWEIQTDDLRYYYALGVSYGLNNWTDTSEEN